MAFGALLLDGTPVRLSGQDSRRGTFRQRHAVVYDAKSGAAYTPLNNIRPGRQAEFTVYDSMLSEFAVLGFEFGYSLDDPETLEVILAQPSRLTEGVPPVLIDEWQRYPPSWDMVRRAVDADARPGRFLLCSCPLP